MRTPLTSKFPLLISTVRNPTLFRVAKWLRDERVDDVAGRVAALNNQSGCPLPDEEVSKIIRKL